LSTPNTEEPQTRQARRRARLRSAAIALCVPSIFCGLLGAGSTLIVWTLIEFDPARPDFYACLLGAAAPISFLLYLERRQRGGRLPSRAVAVALNLACAAAAVVLAVVRLRTVLGDPWLGAILVLLLVAPLLNLAVLRYA